MFRKFKKSRLGISTMIILMHAVGLANGLERVWKPDKSCCRKELDNLAEKGTMIILMQSQAARKWAE